MQKKTITQLIDVFFFQFDFENSVLVLLVVRFFLGAEEAVNSLNLQQENLITRHLRLESCTPITDGGKGGGVKIATLVLTG